MDHFEKNTQWVSAKISEEQFARLSALAEATQTTRSAVIRLLIDHAEIETVASIRFTQPEEAPCP